MRFKIRPRRRGAWHVLAAFVLLTTHAGSIRASRAAGLPAAGAGISGGGDTAPAPSAFVPPAPGDVLYEGAEVIQVIQDLSNSVPLVADRPTMVRVYLGIDSGNLARVRGRLTVKREESRVVEGVERIEFVTVTEVPSKEGDVVTLDPSDNGATQRKRGNMAESLNFELPAEATRRGVYRFSLKVTNRDGAELPCPGCAQLEQRTNPFEFEDVKPFKVVLVGLRYGARERDSDTQLTVAPTDRDFRMIESWLRRAFPVSTRPDKFIVKYKTTIASETWNLPLNCTLVNLKLSALRLNDIKNRYADDETRYVGVIADGGSALNNGGFMMGCAMETPVPDATAVASLPTGSGPVNSKDIDWDRDGVYGDWYTGHEIAHTFGRKHPGKCGEVGHDPDLPTAAIGGEGNTFIGYDAGDPALDIPPRLLPGSEYMDLMTYCGKNWPSAHTYRGIFEAMRARGQEAPSPSPTPEVPIAPAQPSPAFAGPAPMSAAPAGTVPPSAPQPSTAPAVSVTSPSSSDRRAAVIRAATTELSAPAGVMAAEPATGAPPAAPPPGAEQQPAYLSIIARVNITKRTAELLPPSPLPDIDPKLRGVAAPGLTSFPHAKVRLKNKAGALIGEFSLPLVMSSPVKGADEFGYVNGAVPFNGDIVALELVLVGDAGGDTSTETVIASMKVSGEVPQIQNLSITFGKGSEPGHCGLFQAEWEPKQRYKDRVTYNVDMSKDGGNTWSTLVTDYERTSVCFTPKLEDADSAFNSVKVRVTVKNGVDSSESVKDFNLKSLTAQQRDALLRAARPQP